MLVDRKKQIEELKEIFGDEYNDYNLVFCHHTGRPMESQVINNALRKLIEKHNLAKKWTMPLRNWGKVRGELEIMHPDRMQI